MQNALANRVPLAIILLGTASRLLPHPWNVSPVMAIALFAGASLPARAAFTVPLAILALSDLVLGLHATIPFVYVCFLATAWLGTRLAERRAAGTLLLAALASSIGFFAVTNLGVWLVSGLYPRDGAGLAACYAAALPFLRNSLAGDLAFTAALFGLQHASLRALSPRAALA